jgi:hypothetical protein
MQWARYSNREGVLLRKLTERGKYPIQCWGVGWIHLFRIMKELPSAQHSVKTSNYKDEKRPITGPKTLWLAQVRDGRSEATTCGRTQGICWLKKHGAKGTACIEKIE